MSTEDRETLRRRLRGIPADRRYGFAYDYFYDVRAGDPLPLDEVVRLLNEREKYRAALERLSGFKHAISDCPCNDLGCHAGRIAEEALKP